MLPNVGTWEMLIILLVIFMVFGSKRLPDVAKGLGRGMREFKREMQGITEELNKVTEDDSTKPTSGRTTTPPAATQSPQEPPAAEGQTPDAPVAETDESPRNGGEAKA